MENPFKFGSIVEDNYFTDRIQEQQEISHLLNSANHLVLISPRRFGKSSLVLKTVKASGRKYVSLNLQDVTSVEDFAAKLLKAVLKRFPWERMKHHMANFRIIPTISSNPVTNAIDVTFQPAVNTSVLLEDALSLVESIGSPTDRMIVVLDEFQEVNAIAKGLDRQLRSIMQQQANVNYIFMGSQESMMTEIFERKKSPFYHFGLLMRLPKIPHEDFFQYIVERLISFISQQDAQNVAEQILAFTHCHPYYTQQLSYRVWELIHYQSVSSKEVVNDASAQLVMSHDLDFERLWIGFNRTDKRVMQELCQERTPLQGQRIPTSTAFSSLKRLMKMGYVIRTDRYEIEDPFFRQWLAERIK